MTRTALYAGFVTLLDWGFGPGAAAQGFNVRHDAYGWQYPRFGWGFEQNAAAEILVFSNGAYIDTSTNLFWSSIVGMERFSSDGAFLSQDTLWDAGRATYVGWSNCSTVLTDGRVVVSGGTYQTGDTNRTALYWFGQSGQLLDYVEILPTSRSWISYQHKNTLDGGFILTGVTDVNSSQDNFLLKTDSLGNVQWWQTYGHPTRLDGAVSVDHAPNSGYYVGGTYPVTAQNRVKWVMRVDSVGNTIWSEFPGTPYNDTFSAHVATTADGGLVFASGDWSGAIQNHFPQLVKMDTAGNVVWDKKYGFDQYGSGFYVVQEVTPYGDLIACGQRGFNNGMGGGYFKGTLLRTTANGDSLWMYDYAYYDSTVTDCEGTLRDVQPTPDGGFVAVGTAYGAINGNNPPGLSQDVWVVKVDSLGCIEPGCNVPMGVTTQITNLGNALSIAPNPASERVQLIWQLPAALRSKGAAELSIVSAQGMLVRTVPCDLSRGSMELDVQDLAPGVYHLHMVQQGTWISGGKLVVE